MLEPCGLPMNVATSNWLGLAAIVGFAVILILVTLWLRGRAKIEQLEEQIDTIGRMQMAGDFPNAMRVAVGLEPYPVGDIFNPHIRSGAK